MSAHQNPLLCACTASIHLYLLPLPFLLSPTLWAGRKMRAASANYDYAHSKGPSLDLQSLRCRVCKLTVMIDSKLSNATVSACSNAYSPELKKCAFCNLRMIWSSKAFSVYCAALYHIRDEITQRSLKSMLPSCSLPPISAIRSLTQLKVDFLYEMWACKKKSNKTSLKLSSLSLFFFKDDTLLCPLKSQITKAPI